MRVIIYSIFLSINFTLTIQPCWCAFSHPSEAFQKADLIFIGLSMPVGEDSLSFDNQGPKMLFKIEKLFKGNEDDVVEIYSDWSTCGLYLPTGYRFLVYARITKDGTYHTGKCTRTKLLSGAEVDLLFLEGLPETLHQTSVVGHLYNYEDPTKNYWQLPPFSNVEVRVFNDRNNYKTTTDNNGFYKIIKIEPGQYNFSFGVNENYTTRFSNNATIELTQNEFQEVDQILVPNGIICGSLTDINGKPIQRVIVEIFPVDSAVRKSSYIMDRGSLTDSTGFFRFSRIPPGEYYLGINIQDREPITLKYIKAFYPGVDSIHKAQKIAVSFGDSIGSLYFKLPSDKGIFYLKGKVFLEDSTLRVGGKVQLRTARDPLNSELIDQSTINVYNKFSLVFLDGMEGWIHVNVTDLYPKSESNPEIEVPEPIYFKAEKDVTNMNITIRKKIK
jgi:hypothetical protein